MPLHTDFITQMPPKLVNYWKSQFSSNPFRPLAIPFPWISTNLLDINTASIEEIYQAVSFVLTSHRPILKKKITNWMKNLREKNKLLSKTYINKYLGVLQALDFCTESSPKRLIRLPKKETSLKWLLSTFWALILKNCLLNWHNYWVELKKSFTDRLMNSSQQSEKMLNIGYSTEIKWALI